MKQDRKCQRLEKANLVRIKDITGIGNLPRTTDVISPAQEENELNYERGVEVYATLYNRLWKRADKFGCENFKGEDANHYFQVLD